MIILPYQDLLAYSSLRVAPTFKCLPADEKGTCSQETPQLTLERAMQLYAANKETFQTEAIMEGNVSRQGSDGPWTGGGVNQRVFYILKPRLSSRWNLKSCGSS